MPPTPTAAQTKQGYCISQLVSDLLPGVTSRRDKSRIESKVAAGLRAEIGESRKEWYEHRVTLQGLADKARIRVQDDLADALELLVGSLDDQGLRLGHEMRDDESGDSQVTQSNFPLHVQFLLFLADQPSELTHRHAHSILHPLPEEETEDQRLYREIMQEPFQGDHWGPSKEQELGRDEDWELSDDEDGDVSSNSGESQEIRTPVSVRRVQMQPPIAVVNQVDAVKRAELEREVHSRSDGAYWKTGGSEVTRIKDEDVPKGWEALSTYPHFNSLLQPVDGPQATKHISMYEMLRETLMALSGRGGIVFAFDSDGMCMGRTDTPMVPQYSSTLLQSQLLRLAATATAAGRLRKFVSTTSVGCLSTSKRIRLTGSFKTTQAFAEAVNGALQDFDTWLANIEEASLPGAASCSASPVIVTLTSLQRDLDLYHAGLLAALDELVEYTSSPHALLNHLYGLLLALPSCSPFSATLSAIFIATASPLWALIGQWLTSGMPIPAALSTSLESSLDVLSAAEAEREAPMDRELFITRDYDVSWADEDFWSSGFVVQPEEWPAWLPEEVRDGILEAGKAMGLLRVLDADLALEAWPALADLIGEDQTREKPTPIRGALDHRKVIDSPPSSLHASRAHSVPEIPAILGSFLTPRIQLVQRTLRQTMTEDCAMSDHLAAIEGILYARDGAVLHEWATWLFDRMSHGQSWTSFQLLNSALRDAVTDYSASRVSPTSFRLHFPGRQPVHPGVRDLSRLVMDYEVPFPLSLQFTPTSMRLRSEVFALLLQLRYTRYLLLAMVYDEECRSRSVTSGQQQVLRLRQRLLWFVQTIWTFIMESVLDPQIAEYHDKIEGLTSMEDLIAAELEHTRSIRDLSFKHPDTETTHELLISIFEVAQDLSARAVKDQPSAAAGPAVEQRVETLVTDFMTRVEMLARDASPEVSKVWRVLSFALEDWIRP